MWGRRREEGWDTVRHTMDNGFGIALLVAYIALLVAVG